MEATHEAPQKVNPILPLTPKSERLVQRKCYCGSSAGVSGACEECQGKRLTLRRYSRDRATLPRLLAPFGHSLKATLPEKSPAARLNALGQNLNLADVHAPGSQTKLPISQPADRHEQEADRVAAQVTSELHSSTGRQLPHSSTLEPSMQEPAAERDTDADPGNGNEASAEPVGRERQAAAGLIVEDDSRELGPGQMRKTDFLDQLRVEVGSAADAELARVGRDSASCPYIERAFAHYRLQSPGRLERSIHRYAAEAAAAKSAHDYIVAVSTRVRSAVGVWATTGELTGVPTGVSAELPALGLTGTLVSLLSGLGSLAGSLLQNKGSVLSGAGPIFFKRANGTEPPDAIDAGQIKSQLQGGQTLNSGVKAQMEGAFGHDFSRVRIHTGERAAALTSSVSARAFTIGSDIAFGAGEYQPGTLLGDALIAHELAHVVQQGLGSSEGSAMQKGAGLSDSLEEDADISAVNAVASVWGAAKSGLANIARESMPRLRSGLRLQRCPAARQAQPTTAVPAQTKPAGPSVAAACPPALQDPIWDVAKDARVFPPAEGGCKFALIAGLRPSTSPFGPNGMEFRSTIKPAPNCSGSVFFVQYVKVNRSQVGCVDSKALALCSTNTWGIDSAWPYPLGTNVATDAERLITTVDSPGITNISNPDLSKVRICVKDEFVTYIVYDDGKHNLTPLGWMNWIFDARAWRDTGHCPTASKANNCTGWHVAGGGLKVAESFVAGKMGPVALDPKSAVVTAATFTNTDCEGTVCPVPTTAP